jgi:outer membrane lipoprotein carrier protein
MTRRVLATIAVLACPIAMAQEPLPPGLHGADKLAAVVQRVSQMQASTTTLTSDFEQRKTSRLLAEPSVSRGKFYYKAPDSVRWDYEEPRRMTVLLTGGVAITYRPAEKRAERVEVGRAQRRVLRFISAAEPLEKLKEFFSFTFRDPGEAGNYTLLLKPMSHPIKKRLQGVEIEIDRHALVPVRVGYTEADGDTTTYVFSNIERNRPQSPDLFTLALPPDVKVVTLKLGGRD